MFDTSSKDDFQNRQYIFAFTRRRRSNSTSLDSRHNVAILHELIFYQQDESEAKEKIEQENSIVWAWELNYQITLDDDNYNFKSSRVYQQIFSLNAFDNCRTICNIARTRRRIYLSNIFVKQIFNIDH